MTISIRSRPCSRHAAIIARAPGNAKIVRIGDGIRRSPCSQGCASVTVSVRSLQFRRSGSYSRVTQRSRRPEAVLLSRTSHRRNIEEQEISALPPLLLLPPEHSCSPAARAVDQSPRKRPATPTAIITTNGSEPQNPLIPTNTNETGGGKIVTSLFAGLVYYDADGDIEQRRRRVDRVRRRADLDRQAQGGPDLHRRRPGHRELLRRRVELRRAVQQRAERLGTSSTTSRASATTEDSRAHRSRGRRRPTFTVNLVAARGRLAAATRLHGLLPAPRVRVRGHRGLR